jgi:hypothetical protein
MDDYNQERAKHNTKIKTYKKIYNDVYKSEKIKMLCKEFNFKEWELLTAKQKMELIDLDFDETNIQYI